MGGASGLWVELLQMRVFLMLDEMVERRQASIRAKA